MRVLNTFCSPDNWLANDSFDISSTRIHDYRLGGVSVLKI